MPVIVGKVDVPGWVPFSRARRAVYMGTTVSMMPTRMDLLSKIMDIDGRLLISSVDVLF